MFFKKLLSQKGSALIYAMVGSLGVAGLALVLMQRAQLEKKIAVRYKADADVNEAVIQISALLLMPQHCNATLKGLSVPTVSTPVAVNAIRECTSGNCTSGSSYTVYRAVLNTTNMAAVPAADRWKTYYTKFPGGSYASASGESSIRLVGASMYLVRVSNFNAPGAPGEVRIDLTFEKKTVGAQTGGNPAHKSNRVIKSVFVPVVTGYYTAPTSGVQSSTILGCPKSPTSPGLYN